MFAVHLIQSKYIYPKIEISNSLPSVHYKFIDHTFAGYIVHVVIVPDCKIWIFCFEFAVGTHNKIVKYSMFSLLF